MASGEGGTSDSPGAAGRRRGSAALHLRFAAAGLSLLCACSDGDGPAGDGGPPAADGSVDPFGILLPAPPEIPWFDPATGESTLSPTPPELTPCPAGWREVEGACDPWPAAGPASCPEGEAHFPGEPGCALVGSACPTGEFADGLSDDGTVLFVRPGATGGTGTRASPFGTIAEAMAAAGPGTTVALSRGTFVERVTLSAGVLLRGACARDTVLQWSSSAISVVISRAAGTAVADLTISDSSLPAVVVTGADADLTVDGLVVTDATAIGLIADGGAHLVARSIHVRDMEEDAGAGFGRGLSVQEGARAEVSRALFERNRQMAVSVSGGSHLTLTDAAALDTEASSDGRAGRGMWVAGGSAVIAERVDIARSREAGLHVSDVGTTVALADVVIRDTLSRRMGSNVGRGIFVDGGEVRGARVLIERNRTSGVLATSTDAEVVVEDVVIRDTLPQESDGFFGRGVESVEGGRVELRRTLLARNVGAGIFALGTSLTLEDVRVADTARGEPDQAGLGIVAAAVTTLTASRVSLERNGSSGVVVADDGSTAALRDVLITETRDEDAGIVASGLGVDARDGALVSVERAVMDRNHFAGVSAAFARTDLALLDVVVRDTQPRMGSGEYGLGLAAVGSASLDLRRVLLEGNRQVGAFGSGEGSVLVAEDLWIRDQRVAEGSGDNGKGMLLTAGVSATFTRVLVERTHEVGVSVHQGARVTLDHLTVRETRPTDAGGFGMGLGAYTGGAVTASSVRVADATLCGLQIGPRGQMDLLNGVVEECAIGACVQSDGYDLGRISGDVAYRDNGINLEATTLPLPSASVMLDPGS